MTVHVVDGIPVAMPAVRDMPHMSSIYCGLVVYLQGSSMCEGGETEEQGVARERPEEMQEERQGNGSGTEAGRRK